MEGQGIFNLGYAAYAAGRKCPFLSEAHRAEWQRGWGEARDKDVARQKAKAKRELQTAAWLAASKHCRFRREVDPHDRCVAGHFCFEDLCPLLGFLAPFVETFSCGADDAQG